MIVGTLSGCSSRARASIGSKTQSHRDGKASRCVTRCINSSGAKTEVSSSVPSSSSDGSNGSNGSNGSSGSLRASINTSKPPPRPMTGHEIEAAATRSQIELHMQYPNGLPVKHKWSGPLLEDAYISSGEVTSEYAKTFYLGTQLMTPEKARAIWAIYVWCRRTDELVDGPNSARITPAALDRWEERLEALFEGRPYDSLDAVLTDTLTKFPVDIQPFRDMIGGMRMDLYKNRYENYDGLYEYCYRVAGTVALMSTPIMGVDPTYKGPLEPVYKAALALGTANQLTNILRDVGEDAETRSRVYLPLDELDQFGISENEVLRGMFSSTNGKIDDRWTVRGCLFFFSSHIGWRVDRVG